MEELSFKILLLVIFVSSILPSHTRAHIADFDEHWKRRGEEAMKHVEEAYRHNPYDVTDHFDHNVTKEWRYDRGFGATFWTSDESDGDGVSIFGSSNIWVDRLSMRNCYDGLVDAVMGSLAITVSSVTLEITMR
ncbi:hypothetical protein Dimus_023894 [Dionaea muscipula]